MADIEHIVTIAPATTSESAVVRRLLQLHLWELAEITGCTHVCGKADDQAEIAYPYFDSYWQDARREPLLLHHNRQTVGFALVNDWSVRSQPIDFAMAEFFVMAPFRLQGLGTTAAIAIVTDRPGRWEIAVSFNNPAAVAFWQSVRSRIIRDHHIFRQNFDLVLTDR